MGWVVFVLLSLWAWALFDSEVVLGGFVALTSAACFFPPLVAHIKNTMPDASRSKRIVGGNILLFVSLVMLINAPMTGLENTFKEVSANLEEAESAKVVMPGEIAPEEAITPVSNVATRSIDNDPGVAEAQHAVAGLINLNGHLCAKVENVQPLQMRDQVFEVTCTEYRGGSGKVRYLVDGSTGTASRL